MAHYTRSEIIIRNERLRWFEENVLPFVAFEYDVSQPNTSCFKVVDTPKGDLIIYPKGDKISIDDGTWISSNIVLWLNNNILETKAEIYKK